MIDLSFTFSIGFNFLIWKLFLSKSYSLIWCSIYSLIIKGFETNQTLVEICF
jgi:hypothetical protein